MKPHGLSCMARFIEDGQEVERICWLTGMREVVITYNIEQGSSATFNFLPLPNRLKRLPRTVEFLEREARRVSSHRALRQNLSMEGNEMPSTPCATCGGRGQTNFGGYPNMCISCGGRGFLNHGPSSRGAASSSGGRSNFVVLMNLCGLGAAIYLVWPVESWEEGLAAGVIGYLAGGFFGGLLRAKKIGQYLVDAFWTLVRASLLLAAAGAIAYFIAVT